MRDQFCMRNVTDLAKQQQKQEEGLSEGHALSAKTSTPK